LCIDNGYTIAYHLHIQLLYIRTPMRDAAINLRALPQQRDLIDHAASLLGKNRSDFMLETACERAQAVLLSSATGAIQRLARRATSTQPWAGAPHGRQSTVG
jgi:uncharacterized protein (DUF1778 family)